MGSAKSIVLRPISAAEANDVVRRVHYSGKVVQNSQFHVGVFYMGKLEGAMQFGPSLDKRKIAGLVRDSGWHQFIELNRMAFSDALPRNSESRALGIAFRLLGRHAPQLKWCISFADAAQCGDGTIYRAAGFVLTAIKENDRLYEMPDGRVVSALTFMDGKNGGGREKRRYGFIEGEGDSRFIRRIGAVAVPGYQFRYVRFLDPSWLDRLTVPVIPFDEIPAECRMYRGKRGGPSGPSGDHPEEGGSTPTPPLHTSAGGSDG